jgi:hypothetical protein
MDLRREMGRKVKTKFRRKVGNDGLKGKESQKGSRNGSSKASLFASPFTSCSPSFVSLEPSLLPFLAFPFPFLLPYPFLFLVQLSFPPASYPIPLSIPCLPTFHPSSLSFLLPDSLPSSVFSSFHLYFSCPSCFFLSFFSRFPSRTGKRSGTWRKGTGRESGRELGSK